MNGNLAYQQDWREEVIDGKVVAIAPARLNHTRIIRNLTTIFSTYLRNRPCEFFPDGAGLRLAEDQEEYQPDGMVVCDEEKVKGGTVVTGAPDMVIEVLSPSTAKYDRGHKKDVYERIGVREYWIVDPAGMSIEQYILEQEKFVLREVYTKYPLSWLSQMKEDERNAIVTEFQCSLYDDLLIRLDDVFDKVR